MVWLKSIFTVRSASHTNTRLTLREERFYYSRVLPLFVPVFLSFSILDHWVAPQHTFVFYFAFRLFAAIASLIGFRYTRGRTRYGVRSFLLGFPKVACVEYLMLSNHLTFSPYFAGFGLVLFAWAFCVPARFKVSFILCCFMVLPVPLGYLLLNHPTLTEFALVFAMSFGTAMVCALGGHEHNSEIRDRFSAQESLARHLGRRQQEVQNKVRELVRRKTFEDQFSPQVVEAVLSDPNSIRSMRKQNVCVIVIDIENSTSRAQLLPADIYKEVIEEVFDVFSSACMRYNVTIDKFTGDGAQAFTGAPVSGEDDVPRAIAACKKTIEMLLVKRVYLSGLWRGPLNVRFALAEGEALVGFLGRGALKSFTAIGETVSLTHRLGGEGLPWQPIFFSQSDRGFQLRSSGMELSTKVISNLKGFGKQQYIVTTLTLETSTEVSQDYGRCVACGTPQLLDEGVDGIFRVNCPGCASRQGSAAA